MSPLSTILLPALFALGVAGIVLVCLWMAWNERRARRAFDEILQRQETFLEQRRSVRAGPSGSCERIAAPYFSHDINPNSGGERPVGHTLNGKATGRSLNRTSSAAMVRERASHGGNSHQRRVQRRRLARAAIAAGVLLVCLGRVHAQDYTVRLTWTASPSQCASTCIPGTGPTLINVYRAPVTAGCVGGMTWTQIATGVAASGPYVDSGVVDGGDYCYEVRAYFVASGPTQESGGSNWAHVAVPLPKPAAPTSLSGVIP